jgi:glycine/serine hydroxymethyltransferase
MTEVAALIAQVLEAPQSEENLAAVRKKTQTLTERFPLYRWKLAPVGA